MWIIVDKMLLSPNVIFVSLFLYMKILEDKTVESKKKIILFLFLFLCFSDISNITWIECVLFAWRQRNFYKQKTIFSYYVLCVVLFCCCLYIDIPVLRHLINDEHNKICGNHCANNEINLLSCTKSWWFGLWFI